MNDLSKTGLSRETIQKIHSIFSNCSEIKKSYSLGTFKNGSDIDLTIDSNELTLTTFLKIENELDDLLLPYKIDLSMMHKIDDAKLLEHINRIGIVFFVCLR
jgi:predicted nucleotidyltransferase